MPARSPTASIQISSPFLAGSFRCAGGGVDGSIAEAGELFARLDEDRGGVGFLQEVLLELRGERRELGIHRLEGILLGRGEFGASANEIEMISFEHPQRLRVQAELGTIFVELADAGIEGSVEIDRVAMGGQAG